MIENLAQLLIVLMEIVNESNENNFDLLSTLDVRVRWKQKRRWVSLVLKNSKLVRERSTKQSFNNTLAMLKCHHADDIARHYCPFDENAFPFCCCTNSSSTCNFNICLLAFILTLLIVLFRNERLLRMFRMTGRYYTPFEFSILDGKLSGNFI